MHQVTPFHLHSINHLMTSRSPRSPYLRDISSATRQSEDYTPNNGPTPQRNPTHRSLFVQIQLSTSNVQQTLNRIRRPHSPSTPVLQYASNDQRTAGENQRQRSLRISPPNSPFTAPGAQKTFVYSTPFNLPRTAVSPQAEESVAGNLPSTDAYLQSSLHNEEIQARRPDPYIHISLPSLTPSPDRPNADGPPNIVDVAPGLQASLQRNIERRRGRGPSGYP